MHITTVNEKDRFSGGLDGKAQVDFFPTLGDFLDDSAPSVVRHATFDSGHHFAGGHYDMGIEWYGGLTYSQAYDAARSGRVLDVKAFELRDRIASRVRVAHRQNCFLDVTGGSEFDIGGVVTGVPEVVFNYDEIAGRTRKTLALFCDYGANSGVDASSMHLRGAVYMALVDALESSGRFKCSVYATFGNSGANGHLGQANHQIVIRLKDCGERYDPQALGFSLTHPGMFRQLTFGYYDMLPNRHAHGVGNSSYGRVGRISVPGLMNAVNEHEDVLDLTRSLSFDSIPFRDEAGAVKWIECQLKQYDLLEG